MTNYEFLEDLKEKGYLDSLLKKNMLPTKIIVWMKIFADVRKEMETESERMVAYQRVAEKYKVDIRTVQSAVRFCKL